MRTLMMEMPLSISGLLEHAAAVHGDRELVRLTRYPTRYETPCGGETCGGCTPTLAGACADVGSSATSGKRESAANSGQVAIMHVVSRAVSSASGCGAVAGKH
jgi:hypothetical protein